MCTGLAREPSIQTIHQKCLVSDNVKEKIYPHGGCTITNDNDHSVNHLEQLVTANSPHMCPTASGSSARLEGYCRCDHNEIESSYVQLRCRRRSRSRKTKLYHTSSNWRPTGGREAPILNKPQSSRWRPALRPSSVKSFLAVVIILVALLVRVTESCSSKSTPRPRPSSPTNRPNVTFQTYTCPPTYAAWYCLNGAKCFFVKVQDAILYNCECAEGYMGPRCEFKDLDGSYMPARERVILETASIAGGACIAIILTFLALGAFYVYTERHRYKIKYMQSIDKDLSSCERNISPQYVFTANRSFNLLTVENELQKSSRVSSCRVAIVNPIEDKKGQCVCSLPSISETVTKQDSCNHLQ